MVCSWSARQKINEDNTIQTSAHGCELCNDVDQRSSILEQVGESEHRTYLNGRAVETEVNYRCKSCGAEWVNFIVDGLGGYGSFWIPR